ncbi:hypothetical protein K505DRAFT_297961 [Melanomma pulvis-pyrius CBS 109.77]|uniref:J domain-containing protein n=1 Tax=Melanomma pulvis-pyrius CBS 109.77 TaxID=1314802 RepID=A0A6A6XN74_9PLEO|nr:hypothetical protein K505DRAFT_297961 [Melanomma pulvis-pyrius CBS 109.77]
MKPAGFLALALCAFATAAAAWSKEDHEIFRLRDEVEANDGANVTFYDLLGLKPSASQDDVNKGFRKKSRLLHPDKARQSFIANYALENKKKGKTPGVKVSKQPSKKEIDAHLVKATAAYQRLTVIADVLKGPSRERYDHFLRNGFPKWKGTGYYYARFRPGLASVMMGLLVVIGGGMHYFALVVGWRRRREFVERYIRHARRTAWGDDTGIQGIPGVSAAPPAPDSAEDTPDEAQQPMNRRQKRMMDKENKKEKKAPVSRKVRRSGLSTPAEAAEPAIVPQGPKKRIVAENGKVLVVDSIGNVFLEEETEEGVKQEFLLDPDEEAHPTIFDTLLFKLPKFFYNQSVGRVLGNKPTFEEPLLDTSDLPEDEAALQAATANNANGEARKRKARARATR